MYRSKSKRRKITPRQGWAIYLRTSSREAQNPTMSRERQRFNIKRALLERSELPVIDEYVDVMSGRSPHREGYQQMLRDARAGHFSHVAVENAERFGRNDTEALVAIDEMHSLGIAIRFADYPDLNPVDADDRLLITISFTLARRESLKLAQRVQGGIHAKLRNGGHATLAPDGYRNVERRSNSSARAGNGRYERWIEVDPEQFKVWRLAWDLLLTDRYTLIEICEKLDARGYRLRSGRPFVQRKNGRRRTASNTLSKHFHNWFYAGWVVSEKAGIVPKTVRGNWEPMVTTEEFEQGLAILERRMRHRTMKRRHNYLLKGLLFLQRNKGKLIRLNGSTSNAGRDDGGIPYYFTKGLYIQCEVIDQQVVELIKGIQIDPTLESRIRNAYTDEIAERMGHLRPGERQRLEAALKAVDDEETRAARLYASGKITDFIWNELWDEWQEKRRKIQGELDELNRQPENFIADVDAALTTISKAGILFLELDDGGRNAVLREIMERVVVNREGEIVQVDLFPPFAYLTEVAARVKKEAEHEASNKSKNSD